jgi:hypothetical protein
MKIDFWDICLFTILEKGYFEAFMRALDVQVKEMKWMGEAIKKLENKKENGGLEDQLHYVATRNG